MTAIALGAKAHTDELVAKLLRHQRPNGAGIKTEREHGGDSGGKVEPALRGAGSGLTRGQMTTCPDEYPGSYVPSGSAGALFTASSGRPSVPPSVPPARTSSSPPMGYRIPRRSASSRYTPHRDRRTPKRCRGLSLPASPISTPTKINTNPRSERITRTCGKLHKARPTQPPSPPPSVTPPCMYPPGTCHP